MAKAPFLSKAAPTRPKNLAYGRWLKDFEDLTEAELRLVDYAAQGLLWWEPEGWEKKDGRPEEKTPANVLRAELIRFLLLGGDDLNPLDKMPGIDGAWIDGELDISSVKCSHDLCLSNCFIPNGFFARQAKLASLAFPNSLVRGFDAQTIEVVGSIFLRNGFKSEGEVNLSGAKIGGTLYCNGGVFANSTGCALIAQDAEVNRGIFLDDGFKADGEVNLSGAQIGGRLACDKGQFCNLGARSLNAEGVDVKGGLFFAPKSVKGTVSFMQGYAAVLIDNVNAWPVGQYYLNGFRYDRIHGIHNASDRIRWLNGQVPSKLNEDFAPQPWEQLAKVLRETGHSWAASELAIAKQNAMRAAGQIGQREVKEFPNSIWPKGRKFLDRIWNPISNGLTKAWHWFYGKMAGYGYRPQRILYLLALFIAASSLAYYSGRANGLIGPTDPLIHLNAQMARCGTGGDPGAIYWTNPNCPVPPEYSTFQPFVYALDVTLPLVDLHQEADWGPVVTNKAGETLWGGRALRWLMWANIILGWVASLMFVAIVSRLVEKD